MRARVMQQQLECRRCTHTLWRRKEEARGKVYTKNIRFCNLDLGTLMVATMD